MYAAPSTIVRKGLFGYTTMPEHGTVSPNSLINDAIINAINSNVIAAAVSSTGTTVPRMPAQIDLSPVPSGRLFGMPEPRSVAADASPTISVPSIAPLISDSSSSSPPERIPGARSTPVKPPKKYRPTGDDCEIQRCKRSLSFPGIVQEATGEKHQQQRPRASVERRNRRERLRVKQINNTFVTLRNQLPSSCLSPKRNAKKFSKVDTLRMAIEYIRGLQQLINDHDAMYMSAECLALLSAAATSPGVTAAAAAAQGSTTTGEGVEASVASSSSFSYPVLRSVTVSSVLDSASDRSGAESVSSSVPDQQQAVVSGHSLLTDLFAAIDHRGGGGGGGGGGGAADSLLDEFFLDHCNYMVP